MGAAAEAPIATPRRSGLQPASEGACPAGGNSGSACAAGGRSPLADGWVAELALRMRRLFLLKLIGTTAVIGLFFVGYFQVLRNPAYPVTTMPLTRLDRLIPFQPAMLYPYVSLWLYVGLAPGLLLTLRELLSYACWAIGLALTGLCAFYWWPTAVPPVQLDADIWIGFGMLQRLDASGNACPSMHVAFAVLSVAWIATILKRVRAPMPLRVMNMLWFLSIVWSTLAIGQHVVADVVAGAVDGALFAVLSLRWWRDARAVGIHGR